MVIDCIQYRTANNKLFNFLKENAFNNLEIQLLVFWSRHPNAKLSIYSIASALDTLKLNLREAIYSLVNKNILVEQHNHNDLTTYSLNGEWDTKEFIEELAGMDWSQLKVLQKQLEGGAILS